jgi:hypothetical protein
VCQCERTWRGRGCGHLHEGAVADDIAGEDQVPEGRDNQGSEQTVHAQLPGLLALAGSCIDASHEEDDVQGREGIEDLGRVSRVQARRCSEAGPLVAHLEGKVPRVLSVLGGARGEDVEVAGAEPSNRLVSLVGHGDTGVRAGCAHPLSCCWSGWPISGSASTTCARHRRGCGRG